MFHDCVENFEATLPAKGRTKKSFLATKVCFFVIEKKSIVTSKSNLCFKRRKLMVSC
jgi:hypothetical protein